MTETVLKTDTGAILYDRSVVNQISDAHFLPQGWPHAEAVGGRLRSAGRGNTCFVGNVPRQFVLRHFVRGGLVGRFVRDAYWFTGEDRTRSFREWRLLDRLARHGLRVPRPAAARYVRRGPIYRADILTVCIPGVRPLSEVLAVGRPGETLWTSVGTAIAEFQALNIHHADLNAYNIQVDKDGDVWLLDFDRGRIAPGPGPWQQQTLARLKRSLEKINALDDAVRFGKREWDALLAAYFEAVRSA